ncbi:MULTISPECIES: NifU family protein [Micromonospora]|uniref:NifU family protein n=1 Tax=Micromonospora solifontis TaxID=2487138 RepID=A0ABX9W9Y6_9ACTN|nr:MULTISPECIES: NifU family protein [Micromonospora]NES15118.1 NifU family protein [Micromonospora sp. PPF5-17B]NES39138.1 NifU family protein [Micromonospora solifontis]NES56207.1 NifU family protein [Micromonospora sp. PPF5-6]RNL90586.1 NifU family protein [Micromonospora solifontis]
MSVVPLHPQADPARPERVRWIVPAGAVPATGPVAGAPAPLAGLLADGVLTAVVVEPGAVVTELAPGRRWAVDGPRVRTALHAALAEPGRWVTRSAAAPDDDATLRESVRRLLDGPVGDVARSHGGHIELVDVRDGQVRVRLAGACHGCPAARYTLRHRLEAELRRHHPQLRGVVDVAPDRAR